MAPAHGLFVETDYTIIMINAADIQILSLLPSLCPASRGVNINVGIV